MTSYGVGYICEICDGRMTVSDYVHILKIELADTLDYYWLRDDNLIFQHDTDASHTIKIATTCFKKVKYPLFPWSFQLPDLNPIKHIWRHLKLKLALYEQRARDVHELLKRVKTKYETFHRDVCCKHIENMLAKVQAIVKAKGGNTVH